MSQLSREEKEKIISAIENYPKAYLEAYFRGKYLYVLMNGSPLCRLEHDADGLWNFAIYKWSTEKYSTTEFGIDAPPLPMMEHIEFAVRMMS